MVRMRYALIFGYKAQLSILLTKSMILENGSKWNLINDKGIVHFLRKRDPVQMRALTREQPAQQEGMQMQWEGTSMKEQWEGTSKIEVLWWYYIGTRPSSHRAHFPLYSFL